MRSAGHRGVAPNLFQLKEYYGVWPNVDSRVASSFANGCIVHVLVLVKFYLVHSAILYMVLRQWVLRERTAHQVYRIDKFTSLWLGLGLGLGLRFGLGAWYLQGLARIVFQNFYPGVF